MKILTIIAAALLTPLICGAEEKSLPGPTAGDRASTNQPVQDASSSYALELRDKLIESKRVEALEALLSPADWRSRLRVQPAPFWHFVLREPWLTDPYFPKLAEQLKQSKVPTEGDAERAAKIAVRAGRGSQIPTELPSVSALLRLAKADEKLGQAGDFVWEVRIITTSDFKVTGLLWVGASTGEVRVLYRP